MEEKKKTTQVKKNNNKRVNNNKSTAKKTDNVKKAPAKKPTPKKNAPVKKNQVKKPAPKKVEAPKKIEPKVEEKETKEEKLEKTIIFDGKQNKNLKEVVEKLEQETVVTEDKVIKRSKFKRLLVILLAVGMVIVIAAASAYVLSQIDARKKKNETLNSNIYEKIRANELSELDDTKNYDDEEGYPNIVTISLTQFESKVLAKEDMYVLVASSTCYNCIAFEPTVDEVFGEAGKVIYRIDILNLTQDEIGRFRSYYAFTIAPTIFQIKDGVVVADRSGSSSKADLVEWLNKTN